MVIELFLIVGTNNVETTPATQNVPPGPRKYVWWCMGMGTASCLLGACLLAAAMVLRAHTSSLHYLETIPTPVPATMVINLTCILLFSFIFKITMEDHIIG